MLNERSAEERQKWRKLKRKAHPPLWDVGEAQVANEIIHHEMWDLGRLQGLKGNQTHFHNIF